MHGPGAVSGLRGRHRRRGLGAEAENNDIAGKINWIGVVAPKQWGEGLLDPIVTFDHFVDFGTDGDDLWLEAPALAEHMYLKKARIALEFSPGERAEVDRLLALAMNAPPSRAKVRASHPKEHCRCRPVRC